MGTNTWSFPQEKPGPQHSDLGTRDRCAGHAPRQAVGVVVLLRLKNGTRQPTGLRLWGLTLTPPPALGGGPAGGGGGLASTRVKPLQAPTQNGGFWQMTCTQSRPGDQPAEGRRGVALRPAPCTQGPAGPGTADTNQCLLGNFIRRSRRMKGCAPGSAPTFLSTDLPSLHDH